jgi:hypothetical protein
MEKETLTELARMRKLAGINESFGGNNDDGDGIDGVDAVSVAAKAAAETGKPAPTAEEIAQHVAQFAQAFEFLKAQGMIKPEYLNPMGESEELDESIDSKIKKSMKAMGTAATWLGWYMLLGPALDALGVPHPDLSHVSYEVLGMVSPDGPVDGPMYGGDAY